MRELAATSQEVAVNPNFLFLRKMSHKIMAARRAPRNFTTKKLGSPTRGANKGLLSVPRLNLTRK
jgi:hypothetical protein